MIRIPTKKIAPLTSIAIPNTTVMARPEKWTIQLVIFARGKASARVSVFDVDAAIQPNQARTWWRHQMETFSALLAICAGN